MSAHLAQQHVWNDGPCLFFRQVAHPFVAVEREEHAGEDAKGHGDAGVDGRAARCDASESDDRAHRSSVEGEPGGDEDECAEHREHGAGPQRDVSVGNVRKIGFLGDLLVGGEVRLRAVLVQPLSPPSHPTH